MHSPINFERLHGIVKSLLPVSQDVVDLGDVVERGCFAGAIALRAHDREGLHKVFQGLLRISFLGIQLAQVNRRRSDSISIVDGFLQREGLLKAIKGLSFLAEEIVDRSDVVQQNCFIFVVAGCAKYGQRLRGVIESFLLLSHLGVQQGHAIERGCLAMPISGRS